MKATANGALNLSILDGWWDEACSPRTGWSIGRGEDYQDLDYQDRVEAGSLYDLLEREVVPLFYSRGRDSLPREWIALMKGALCELCPVFNTNRMVHEYTLQAYCPARDRRDALERDDYRAARDLARWRAQVRRAWPEVRVVVTEVNLPRETRVGALFEVKAAVRPAGLAPEMLAVQAVVGRVDENREIIAPRIVAMELADARGDGQLFYRSSIACDASGTQGVTVRVLPRHESLGHPHQTGLVTWAS
jgi:starch phosphorylase